VPPRIREDLSVESGLNDGICVPILFSLLVVSGAAAQAGAGAGASGALSVARLFLQQVGIALVVGFSFAALGSWCRQTGLKRHWISDDWQPVLPIALTVSCYCVAQLVGGSGFIACFTSGLMFGGLTARNMESALVAAEGTGDVLSLITWVAFGTVVVRVVLPHLSSTVLLYAVLSLTVVRMLPVALATAGLGLDRWTTLFIGWFGPRGLASIVFAVIVLDANLPHGAEIVATITVTVLLSVVAHGLSAQRLVGLYGRIMQSRA
jgi:NhaP-type Na+/H+ or K+/H+ antiporter